MLRILLLLIVLPVYAFTQTDYIVTAKADTLRGEVRILSYDIMDRVQVNTGKKKEIFTALQVLGVYLDEKFYRPVQYDKRVMMMQQLKAGYLSLYAFRLPNQATYDGRYLYRLDGKNIEVPNLGFKKIVSAYLEGCPDLSEKIKAGELGKKDLDQILDDYNTCMASARPAEAAPAAKPVVNNRVIAIQNLKQKIAGQDFASKKDALDLLNDLEQKAGRQETIPNYLLEGLKSYLASVATVQADLENLLALLKE
ncbi:MAG: hypothetical protein KIT62_06205 [Cyclobacteriaceae bacterium]|nr:hypothetical protein [Cyclobacteriaceae bacterium]